MTGSPDRTRLSRSVFGCLATIIMFTMPVAACSSPTATGQRAAPASRALDSATAGDTVPLALVMAPWITWQHWHGTGLPASPRWGPTRVQGDVATGFSHTPEGAVVAMMQHQARLAGIGGTAWVSAARAMAVVAPADRAPDRRVPTGFDSEGELPLFAGFRWVSYSPDRAVADLALQDGDGRLRSVHATETWVGADWKAELPANGGSVTPLPGLDGFQPWPRLPRG
ncbi:hypothetical protein IU497_35460 [Nocardia terpenica]|nr:hypothetical protein [Nocardia terpenica]